MREFKFRAWHKNNTRMCSTFLPIMFDREYLEIMQYTGMKDKNGKEIYECDIVKFNALSPMSNISDGTIGKVEFSECAFWVLDEFNRTAYRLFDELQQWEVIGNIYENQELLK